MTELPTEPQEHQYITSLKDLKYANAEGTEYIATVKYERDGADALEIVARFMDSDAKTLHIAEGLERIRSGEFGDPSPYVPPTQEELDDDEAIHVRIIREMKLVREVDPLVTNALRWAELTPEKQAEWTQYRTDLLNLPQQQGFPNNVTWPTEPS
jgi:hypothetical protein